MPIVTLLTDYGNRDAYVAALKGVILGIAPRATLVDITHEIEPYNVAQAAFILGQAWPWFPKGTVHLVVVDPGVGTQRRMIAGQYAGRFVVAPDNGLLTWVHRDVPCEAMHVVEDRRYFLSELSTTFHGRDIMAPVAAHLANGVNLRNFGRLTDRLETLPTPHRAERTEHGWRGQVVYVDRFGNLVTNIHQDQLVRSSPDLDWEVSIDGASVGLIRSTFSDVPPGSAVAYIGGTNLLEVAVNQGRGADRFEPQSRVDVWPTQGTPRETAGPNPKQ